MGFIHYLKHRKYLFLVELTVVISAVLLWQIGLKFESLRLIIPGLIFGPLLIFGWWWWRDTPSDLSLFDFVTLEIFLGGAVVLDIIQPSPYLRFLLGIILILGWLGARRVRKELTKNSDKADENEP